MDNDLFAATETLNAAFKEALESNKPKNKWGTRSVFKRLKEAIEQRSLTLPEKLLLCYDIDHKDLFPSRNTKAENMEHILKKHSSIMDEEKLLWETFRNLPKSERDRIWKEIGMHDLFNKGEKPLGNNTTTAFEHNKNKGKKNGE